MTYRVRYRASNVNGWSDWSPIGYIQAASVPDAPETITLVSSSSSSITVQVNPSLYNGGSPITSYTLYMDSGDLTSAYTVLTTITPASTM